MRSLLSRFRLDEEHVWYALELPGPGAAPFGDEGGLELVRPEGQDLERFAELPTLSPAQAARHVAQGGEPWMVMEGDVPIFACWLYRERAPMLAARGGWLAVPAGCVVLEDSVAAERARGRGIAPRVWGDLAARLRAEGRRELVTKIETANAPSRRAVAKVGFREIGVMRLRRRGLRDTVTFESHDPEGPGPLLRAALER